MPDGGFSDRFTPVKLSSDLRDKFGNRDRSGKRRERETGSFPVNEMDSLLLTLFNVKTSL